MACFMVLEAASCSLTKWSEAAVRVAVRLAADISSCRNLASASLVCVTAVERDELSSASEAANILRDAASSAPSVTVTRPKSILVLAAFLDSVSAIVLMRCAVCDCSTPHSASSCRLCVDVVSPYLIISACLSEMYLVAAFTALLSITMSEILLKMSIDVLIASSDSLMPDVDKARP